MQVNDMPVTVGVGSLLSKEGFSLLMSPGSAEPIWRALLRLGAVPMGSSAWERLRILQGHNPTHLIRRSSSPKTH